MGRPYAHQYTTTASSRCGTMRCGGCGKHIETGEYRAYKRSKAHDWGFVTHHRACCSNDPAWAKRDAAAVRNSAMLTKISDDVRALFARYPERYWGVISDEVETFSGDPT